VKGPTSSINNVNPYVLVAISEGLLENHIVRELRTRNLPIKILARNARKAQKFVVDHSEIIEAAVTLPTSLKGKLEGVHTVILTFGSPHKKKGLFDSVVNYHGALNLLQEARRAGVEKFIYLTPTASGFRINPRVLKAKTNFISQLKASGIGYTFVHINGVFSDSADYCHVDQEQKNFFYRSRKRQINPVNSKDLAIVCVDAIKMSLKEINIEASEVLPLKNKLQMPLRFHLKTKWNVKFYEYLNKMTGLILQKFKPSGGYETISSFPKMFGEDDLTTKYENQSLSRLVQDQVDDVKNPRDHI